jgi:hypothetical protein
MTRTPLVLTALATALVGALSAMPAQAQRVFVAAQGADGNPCTFAAPCRTFQHAHDVVPAGGEIDVLDPAGYGMLTITKAISIQGHGFSGISVSSVAGVVVGSAGAGITVNAGATDAVSLNGLLIDGNGVGRRGILFNSGKSLVVENCVVRNLTLDGLRFESTAATPPSLSVSNSYFTDNATGISVATNQSGAASASIDRSVFYRNTVGVRIAGDAGIGPLNVTVADSVAANNDNVGFLIQSLTGRSISTLTLTRVVSSGNGIGIVASGPTSTGLLAQSTVTANGAGFNASSGGAIRSYGDNYIDNNGANTGALGAATKQ